MSEITLSNSNDSDTTFRPTSAQFPLPPFDDYEDFGACNILKVSKKKVRWWLPQIIPVKEEDERHDLLENRAFNHR